MQNIKDTLSKGGVIMHPTETCYGFAVDVFNEEALQKLYKLKGRDANKPISILVVDLAMAQKYGKFSEKALALAEKYWPGPLTIVVPRKESLPTFFNPGESYVGIRHSDNDVCAEICRINGRPVTTTSANISGQPPLYKPDIDVFGELAAEIDLVIDGGEISAKKPSTVVKVVDDEIELLRQGDLVPGNDFLGKQIQ